jgi:hypothetical protein
MAKLSPSFRYHLRTFSFWVANRTVGLPVLEGIDYSCIFSEPSALEMAYAIYCNVLDLDDSGTVLNDRQAQQRAAQYIRSYCEPSYVVEPPFEVWELELF